MLASIANEKVIPALDCNLVLIVSIGNKSMSVVAPAIAPDNMPTINAPSCVCFTDGEVFSVEHINEISFLCALRELPPKYGFKDNFATTVRKKKEKKIT